MHWHVYVNLERAISIFILEHTAHFEQTNRRYGKLDEQRDKQKDGWTDLRMDGKTDRHIANRCLKKLSVYNEIIKTLTLRNPNPNPNNFQIPS